jgi:hypothetical protein
MTPRLKFFVVGLWLIENFLFLLSFLMAFFLFSQNLGIKMNKKKEIKDLNTLN